MSTVAEKPSAKPGTSLQTQVWEFTPFMSKEPIKLSLGIVKSFVAVPTRSGALPHERDIVRFITLCKARGLNPFEGDAYLVGYDSKNGPTFSLITAHQALIKRAEVHPEYDGMESGVLVEANGQVVPREGAFFLSTDTVVGGWATVYFKTRSHPMKKALRLSVYNTGRSRWEVDPAGMIVKVAEAAALRASFPNTLGGMYLREEYSDEGNVLDVTSTAPAPARPKATSLDALAERLMPTNGNGHREEATGEAQDEPLDEAPVDSDEMAADMVRFKEACLSAKSLLDLQSAENALRGENGRELSEGETILADTWKSDAETRIKSQRGERSNKSEQKTLT